jgi:hypothetical protein
MKRLIFQENVSKHRRKRKMAQKCITEALDVNLAQLSHVENACIEIDVESIKPLPSQEIESEFVDYELGPRMTRKQIQKDRKSRRKLSISFERPYLKERFSESNRSLVV